MRFDDVLEELRGGRRVARAGWNGRGMWLVLVTRWDTSSELGRPRLPFVAMVTAQGDLVPWLCSQTDMLALDWEVLS